MSPGQRGLLALALLFLIPVSGTAAPLEVDGARLEARLQGLAAFGRNPEGGVSRVAYTDADLAGRAYIVDLLHDLGLEPRIDAAGNILARRSGRDPDLAPILFGSHIDSVPHGGNYDGDAGVMAAIEVLATLNDAGLETRHPLEIVVFSNEEGGLIGSKAFAGILDAAVLDERSQAGMTIGEGIARIGGDPAHIAKAAHSAGAYAAYLELHIEQGAVLDRAGEDIGVVTGIVGIDWWEIAVTGVANHAGTTPMDVRHDALVGAAEMILAVHRIAREEPGTQVATVGRIAAFPGAPNVIPGRVEMSLEIRDLSNAHVLDIFAKIRRASRQIAKSRGLAVAFRKTPIHEVAKETAPHFRDLIEAAARARGYSFRRMPSGAGHDAQAVAHIAPIGMIFVPSVGGISHAPEEFTAPDALARGANVLLDAVLAIDAMKKDERAR